MSAGRATRLPDSRFGIATTTAVEVITSTVLWLLAGRLLDLVVGTGPWLTFTGACLGCWIGLYLAWSGARQRERDEHADVHGEEARDATAQARPSSEPSS